MIQPRYKRVGRKARPSTVLSPETLKSICKALPAIIRAVATLVEALKGH